MTGSSLAAGDGPGLTYPGAPLDGNGSLYPENSSSGNTVTILYGDIPGNAYGAKTGDGNAVRNSITMNDGSVGFLVGASSQTGTVEHNSVLLDGGTVRENVYGGQSLHGDARYNSVMMTSGTANWLAGAHSQTGTVAYNSVSMSGGYVSYLVGAYSQTGPLLKNNTITMSGGYAGSLLGAYSRRGTAEYNSVLLDGGTVTGNVYGAESGNGDARYNSISMTSGTAGFLVGAYSQTGTVAYNSVSMSGGDASSLAGAYSQTGTAEHNSVFLDGGTVWENIYGGQSDDGNSRYNSISMSGGSVTALIGGYSNTGTMEYNFVSMSGGNAEKLFGAYSDMGTAEHNSVLLNGGTVTGNVYGGRSLHGDARNNSAIMTSGSASYLLGAYSETGNVQYNSVLLGGGTVENNVYGGESTQGNARYNSVTMTSGTANWLLGAYSETGNVEGNRVIVSGGTLTGGVSGAESASGNAVGNSVQFSNVTATNINGGYTDTGSASGNRLVIDSGVAKNNVFGGMVNSGTGRATNNLVVINGGEIGSEGGEPYYTVYGIFGGRASAGDAVNNRVVMTGGHTGFIEGGTSMDGGTASYNSVLITGGRIDNGVTGGFSRNSSSSHNTVEIRGGSIRGHIYGGKTENGAATHNTVILAGMPDLEQAQIMGGFDSYAPTPDASDVRTGNTLILDGFQGKVAQIANFERYDIRLSTWAGDGNSVLTVSTEIPYLASTPTDLSGAAFRVKISGFSTDSPLPSVGETISLIRNENGINTTGMTLETPAISGVKRGISFLYDVAVTAGENSIDATITGRRLNPQTKSLSEGRAAAMLLAGQGGDLVAGQGINNAVLASMQGTAASGVQTFFAMSGSHSQYDTGSHVDLSGFSVLTGVSTSLQKLRSLVLGGFFETGWGNYTSHNTFADASFVRASGDTSYYGGGALARYNLTSGGLKGLALEASFRAGRLDADYHSGDLTDGAGNASGYNLSSPYCGGHAGLSYERKLGSKIGMSSYARFLWTRQDGDRADIAGDNIRFRAMDSHRLQGGARFHYEAAPAIRPYAGAAYEWECSGASRAVTYGQDIAAPSLRGGTGMAELGVVFQPLAEKPIFLDLGVKGYTGKRDGFGGNIQLRASF
ncbi:MULTISPECIES: hypothetical protein [unclassified Akkermansia]|uniref:beta strand repeat-containing protein n=1 Tax=unclassified Akkermansia TaxID=2608915 RepID=UPI0008371ED0|nr:MULTISPECIES: hypothetical protein [unclassified Akkermansia]